MGPHAEPVLRAVCDGELSGASIDEIGVATLYSPKRALKYLHGMRDVGLPEERDSVWHRTNITLDEAEYRSQDRLNAGAETAS
ncbi:hypothetical protein HNR06_005217 [Nocardiopsis arvandica]|uniref:Uncharacterized protein n=1 Tax=Nocardiopsis sinuspersici TaxID=501010 RepID=A0A7Y9XH83_9ACTN|nr:hypothetical protein [Nocardiopsis sinuspersici]NYH55628.1 hypothetical protein [Nocardiopsis sinuspersici]